MWPFTKKKADSPTMLAMLILVRDYGATADELYRAAAMVRKHPLLAIRQFSLGMEITVGLTNEGEGLYGDLMKRAEKLARVEALARAKALGITCADIKGASK